MNDKFTMPQKENLFLAKRILVDSIYKSANLEGIAVTFAETNDILNDVNISRLKPSEITKICCMRDAWKYLFDHIDDTLDLAFLENIHEHLARADVEYYDLGKIRDVDVMISGTTWRPELPDPEVLHKELQQIMKTENATERAINVLLWIMKSQVFKDGNKRVATLAANKILIESGHGIFSVPVDSDGAFKTRLVKFYETDDMSDFKRWIYDNCIDGVNISLGKPKMKGRSL